MPPIYAPVPTVDKDEQVVDLEASGVRRARRTTVIKKIFFHILAVIAIMYALVLAARGIPAACRMIRNGKIPNPVHTQKLNGCHGANRTLSTGAGLPSFHMLPSGDKIPSVALGEPLFNFAGEHEIESGCLGVWRADPGHVGEAVKVCFGFYTEIRGLPHDHFCQTALRAGYRHIDGAWIYGVGRSTIPCTFINDAV
jgi:hypothetical protein